MKLESNDFSALPGGVMSRSQRSQARALVSCLVTDKQVSDYAEEHDCTMLEARADLYAEAYAELAGEQVDYGMFLADEGLV